MTAFVLLHGAYHAGWHLHLLAQELTTRGHAALAPDLPSEEPDAGFERYVAAVARALEPVEIAGGHAPFLARPAELAELLVSLA